MYAKIYFEIQFRQKKFKKYVDLVSSQVAEGTFSSKVSDFRVLNSWSFWELYRLVPTTALPWTYEGASQSPLLSQTPCWNRFPQKIPEYVTAYIC